MTTIQLEDFQNEIYVLQQAVENKISNSLISEINSEINTRLKITNVSINNLLKTIHRKLKLCQETHYVYFEGLNHQELNGISQSGSKQINFNVVDTLGSKNISIEFTDLVFYKENVISIFQQYILTIASLYENLVRLIEMLIKKTIVNTKGKDPLSAPLHLLIDYRRLLVKLDYRTTDEFINCIDLFEVYFNKYLIAINELRNSYLHSPNDHLEWDGSKYVITRETVVSIFGKSPDLEIDNFTKNILDNTLDFAKQLFICLSSMIQKAPDKIPV